MAVQNQRTSVGAPEPTSGATAGDALEREREDLAAQWSTALRLAVANGASLRKIAKAAGVSPQTVANICRSG